MNETNRSADLEEGKRMALSFDVAYFCKISSANR
jgi:hypothetical protein